VSEKVDEKLKAMLSGAYQFICTVGPFDLSLGVRVDDDDDRGDGLNADGTYTARDKDHAHALMRDGNQGNKYIDAAKVIAAVEWFKEHDAPGYNCGSVRGMCHKAEATIARDDQARSRGHYSLESFEGTPGIHHLIKIVAESIDLEDPKCKPVFIFGHWGVGKTEFMKAVVARVLGDGVFKVNGCPKINDYQHLLVRNAVLFFDDFKWKTTANGTLLDIEDVKGLLTQKDSDETSEILCRAGESSKIRHDVIKCGTSNCPTFEGWYGGQVPLQHLGAVMRRIRWINLHSFKLPSGEVVDFCPVMTDDVKRLFVEGGGVLTELLGEDGGIIPGSEQRWPIGPLDIGVPHPNAGKPWASSGGATQPPPPQTQLPPPQTQPPPPQTQPPMFDDLAGELDLGDNGDWFDDLPTLAERISGALRHVDVPGTDFTSTAIVTRMSSHEMFMSVVTKIKIAFDGRWNSETRDRLVGDIAYKIPDLDSGYFLKHMIRSVSYVSGLDAIPCRDKY